MSLSTRPASSTSSPCVDCAGQSSRTLTSSSVATPVLTRAIFACSVRASSMPAKASSRQGSRRKLGRSMEQGYRCNALSTMTPRSPRLLLVEDDAVSRAFLAAAIAALPAEVEVAETCAMALRLAQGKSHDLWLVDAHLPDGNGRDLLRELRALAPAIPAIAHTASHDREDLDALIDAGFAEVLLKPLSAIELQAAVRRALGPQPPMPEPESPRCGKLPVWDDDAAASALNGNHQHVQSLRRLFLDELPAQRDAVLVALHSDDQATVRMHLHRLQASCGFVGAARLAEAVRVLQGSPASQAAREGFAHAVDDALAQAD